MRACLPSCSLAGSLPIALRVRTAAPRGYSYSYEGGKRSHEGAGTFLRLTLGPRGSAGDKRLDNYSNRAASSSTMSASTAVPPAGHRRDPDADLDSSEPRGATIKSAVKLSPRWLGW